MNIFNFRTALSLLYIKNAFNTNEITGLTDTGVYIAKIKNKNLHLL